MVMVMVPVVLFRFLVNLGHFRLQKMIPSLRSSGSGQVTVVTIKNITATHLFASNMCICFMCRGLYLDRSV